jgi:ribosomal protein S18 acetylase RimI-like enzyme
VRPKKDFRIREMTSDDYEEAYSLWQETEGLSLEESDSREDIEIYLRRNQGFCFVACSNDRIVGTVLCGHEGRRGILRHLVVKRKFKDQGIARALVNRCLSSLANQGIKKCNTFVLDENVGGRRFWEHMGWYVLEDNYRTMQIPTVQNKRGKQ